VLYDWRQYSSPPLLGESQIIHKKWRFLKEMLQIRGCVSEWEPHKLWRTYQSMCTKDYSNFWVLVIFVLKRFSSWQLTVYCINSEVHHSIRLVGIVAILSCTGILHMVMAILWFLADSSAPIRMMTQNYFKSLLSSFKSLSIKHSESFDILRDTI
jgi:hypothetical protein